jgi:hypothetical protein
MKKWQIIEVNNSSFLEIRNIYQDIKFIKKQINKNDFFL